MQRICLALLLKPTPWPPTPRQSWVLRGVGAAGSEKREYLEAALRADWTQNPASGKVVKLSRFSTSQRDGRGGSGAVPGAGGACPPSPAQSRAPLPLPPIPPPTAAPDAETFCPAVTKERVNWSPG